MASNTQPTKQLMKRESRMFSASDDSAMMKQIQATHTPDGRDVEVKPILQVIEDVMHLATPRIDGVTHASREQVDAFDRITTVNGLDSILEALSYIIHKISCELLCKCSGGADAHATTMSIFNLLAYYSWEAKVVISLAAFAVNYGEFWLVAQLCATNQLAKSVALLKQMPDIMEHANTLKSRFDAISGLIKAMLDVTKCIVEFKELPAQYISTDTPPLSTAMAHIPTAAYWTIRSMVACASQITGLLGMSYEYITSTTEAWELSSLAHKVSNIHGHLKQQLSICYQHIDEKRHIETFHMLIRLFEMVHLDNMRVVKQLIYPKDDLLPLVIIDGATSTKTRVSVDVLRRKTVLLLISDLEISDEEILTLSQIYHEGRSRSEVQYEVVWLPVVDMSLPWKDEHQQRFEHMQSMMPWYSLHHPSLLDPAVIRYIKEVWHFNKKLILVVLDPQGKVVCPNALHMIWIWGTTSYPFTSAREESLWKEEVWRLELVVDGIDAAVLEWAFHSQLMRTPNRLLADIVVGLYNVYCFLTAEITNGRFICLYGGDDIDWIRKFTTTARRVAQTAGIALEMVYVGKNSAKERVKRIAADVARENLSHTWTDPISVWYFWVRLESMLYSKIQSGKTIVDDHIMQEVLTLLSYDGSDEGWAMFSRGLEIARSKGNILLTSFEVFNTWEENAKQIGFLPALNQKLLELHSPIHCNRLILPGISGGIPERVVCAECGRPMERFFMYRCCTD